MALEHFWNISDKPVPFLTVSAEPCGGRSTSVAVMSLPPRPISGSRPHIVGVVVWFAGLFYLVRLFIYHVETAELTEELQQLSGTNTP